MNKQENPFIKPCNELFAKLNITYGLLFHLVSHLNNYRKSIKYQLEQNNLDVSTLAAGSALIIQDLTESTEDNWARYYPTGSFGSRGEDYLNVADNLIHRESAWTISQAYEAFETYLKDVTALYLVDNPSNVDKALLEKNKASLRKAGLNPNNLEYWKMFVRLSYRSSAKALEYLRLGVPELRMGEKHNNRAVDMDTWFEVVSEARHATIHNNLLIKTTKTNAFTNLHNDLLKQYFPGNSTEKGYELQIVRKSAETALVFFEEYAFLVFKCLSIKQGYNWQMLLNQSKKPA